MLKTPLHHHCNFFLCKIEIVLGSVTACFESFYQQWEIPLNPRLIGSLSYTKSMNFSANSTFFELFCASPFLQGKKSRLLNLMRIEKIEARLNGCKVQSGINRKQGCFTLCESGAVGLFEDVKSLMQLLVDFIQMVTVCIQNLKHF